MTSYLNCNYDIMPFILNTFTVSIKSLTSLEKSMLKNLMLFLDNNENKKYRNYNRIKCTFIWIAIETNRCLKSLLKACLTYLVGYHMIIMKIIWYFMFIMITRSIFNLVNEALFKDNVILIFGTRRVGKTTLLQEIIKYHEENGKRCLYLDCEHSSSRRKLDTTNDEDLRILVEDLDILAIDEAQNIETIGRTLKIIHDTFPHVQVIATGSSSFDLANKTGEPLVGRMRQFLLYPLSVREIWKQEGIVKATAGIDNFLRLGLYPKIYDLSEKDAIKELDALVGGYLYKDLLTFDGIRNSEQIHTLLEALALQVGSEVSYYELAQGLQISTNTVKKYIDLLEKCYVIFKLPALSRNIRSELLGNRTRKIYFYDIGVRNALIEGFQPLKLRPDSGAIWENFCIVELKKKAQREDRRPRYYFWRTVDQKEIDLLEEEDGAFNVYEFKLGDSKKAKLPKGFDEHYNVKSFNVITKDNWHRFF